MERELIEKDAIALGKRNGDGCVTEEEWSALVHSRAHRHAEKALLLEYIGRVTETGTDAGQQALRRAGFLGVLFFSITGTHAAGDAGFHVMGATLVGCVTAIGGGTLNGVMMGTTPVTWMVQPAPLIASLLAGVLTFYCLPLAAHAYDELAGEPLTVSATADDDTYELTSHAPPHVSYVRGAMFAMESVALATFSVVGAQSGIMRGLPPVVCVCLGVAITFGGVFRDVIIQRDVALGNCNQSYGLASAAGSSTYVALRELHVRYACQWFTGGLPLTLRIAAGMGAALAVRIVAWNAILAGEDFLQPMHDAKQTNLAWLKSVTSPTTPSSGGQE